MNELVWVMVALLYGLTIIVWMTLERYVLAH